MIIDLTESLRALYLGDNFIAQISPEIGRLKNLQIVSRIRLKNDLFENLIIILIYSWSFVIIQSVIFQEKLGIVQD